MAHCLIGLGSNLGDRAANLNAAREQLAALSSSSLSAFSSLHESKPAGGPTAQIPYLNAAAVVETSLSPLQLLRELQQIENNLGRARLERWGPRTIDLDLLLYDEQELNTPELTLPHPRMSFRRFVLEPAAEIAKEMVYPINRWTIERLLMHLNTADNAIELAPTHSRWSEHSPAARLLKALESEPFIQPEHRRAVVASDSNARNRNRIKSRIREGKRALPPEPQRKRGARWHVYDFWEPQLVYEANYYNLQRDETTNLWLRNALQSKLVVVWDPHESDALWYILDKIRRLPDARPVLWLPKVSLEEARQEVIAAMAAME